MDEGGSEVLGQLKSEFKLMKLYLGDPRLNETLSPRERWGEKGKREEMMKRRGERRRERV